MDFDKLIADVRRQAVADLRYEADELNELADRLERHTPSVPPEPHKPKAAAKPKALR